MRPQNSDFYVKFLDFQILANNFFFLMFKILPGSNKTCAGYIQPVASRAHSLGKQTFSHHPAGASWDLPGPEF